MIWMCQLPPSLELTATAHRFAILTLYSPYPDTHIKACLIFSYWTQCCLIFAQLQCVQCSDTIKSLILIFSLIFLKELVNLLLCGRAVSNVFDNEMKLDSGNGNFTLLKGIKARCNIGLLSLFEHYNICKVIRLQTL